MLCYRITMRWKNIFVISLLLVAEIFCADSDYNIVQTDGSFDFRYDNPDSFHESHGNRNNVVKGVFGGRNPGTGAIDSIEYTAGPRGFRPKGKNVARKYDFGQIPRGPIGNKDDPYYDPYEDPSYNFQFNTRSYVRKEGANRLGDVKGSYSFIDDVGDRHDVEYIAGKNTGFHVKTPHPDSNPNSFRTTYFRDPRKPYLRGRSFVQRGLDGSYRFAAVGPDQRRTETSDAVGNVRGSYTYRDEKGVQHSVHYIAGPNIGYRVLKNVKGPHLPTFYPFNSPDIVPPDFYDNKEADLEVFTQAASSYVTPPPGKDNDYFPDNTNQVDINQSTKRPGGGGLSTEVPLGDFGDETDEELFDDLFSNGKPGGSKPGTSRPSVGKPSTVRPSIGRPSTTRPTGGRPSIARPTTRRPSFGGSTTERPGFGISITTGQPTTSGRPGFDEQSFEDSSTITSGFETPTTTRPSFSTARPGLSTTTGISETGRPSTTLRPYPPATTKPTTYSPGTTRPSITGGRPRPTTSRPSGRPRPTIDFGLPDGEIDDDDIFGAPNKPRPSAPVSRPSLSTSSTSSFPIGRPQPTTPILARPSTSSFSKPTLPTNLQEEKPVLQFDLTGIEKGKFHTLVTNLGDTLFTVPPGVSVRAHVQNIDLIPLFARSPSPSEQYNAETEDEDQTNAETSNTPISNVQPTHKIFPTTTPSPSTARATTKKSMTVTTNKPDEKDEDDDDIDIF